MLELQRRSRPAVNLATAMRRVADSIACSRTPMCNERTGRDASGTILSASRSTAMENRRALSGFVISLATAIGLSAADVSAQPAIWELGTLTCSLAPELQHAPSEP